MNPDTSLFSALSQWLHMLPVPMRMAGATGLEPAASCVTGRRSNQLNYAPAWDTFIIVPSDIAQFPLVSSRPLPLHLTVP